MLAVRLLLKRLCTNLAGVFRPEFLSLNLSRMAITLVPPSSMQPPLRQQRGFTIAGAEVTLVSAACVPPGLRRMYEIVGRG